MVTTDRARRRAAKRARRDARKRPPVEVSAEEYRRRQEAGRLAGMDAQVAMTAALLGMTWSAR